MECPQCTVHSALSIVELSAGGPPKDQTTPPRARGRESSPADLVTTPLTWSLPPLAG